MQVHVQEDGAVHVYSRNLENTTSKYPDIVARVPQAMAPGVKSVVLDGEVQAWDTEKKVFLPFQVLTTRKRKDVAEDQIKVQVLSTAPSVAIVFCGHCLPCFVPENVSFFGTCAVHVHWLMVHPLWCLAVQMD